MGNDICKFAKRNSCSALINTRCNGQNKLCSFFKTDVQFDVDLDRAILINQKKGNCIKCKYNCNPCKLSGRSNQN